MKHALLGFGLVLAFSTSAFAAGKKATYVHYQIPQIVEASFNDESFIKEKKDWSKQNRKLASDSAFQAGDLSPDFIKLRDEWLQVKTGDQMESLLKISHSKFGNYSDDTKYFLAQMHIALPLRGIIWRLRPLFEAKKGFFGNKSSHVMAVQAVRGAVTGLKSFLPTNQTDAAIQYFTEPSAEMSKADQFTSMADFQQFLTETIVPRINNAANQIAALTKSSTKVFVWDNKMAFGRATFEDELNRYVGHGPVEVNFVLASLYRSYHDLLVYCAYNQDYAIKLSGEIGSHLGVDSGIFASRSGDLGITDQERSALVQNAAKKHHFLELRNYENTQYGSKLMKQAYVGLKNSVIYSERAYDLLQGKDANKSMVVNPVMFQPDLAPNLDSGVKNMKALVQGQTEVRDPVTGDTAAIDVPAFYSNPPQSLSELMATGFEGGEAEKSIKAKNGETLKVRNYLRGRSIAWNNEAWKKYVPSANGKKANYMHDARRIMQYSRGTSVVFGIPDMFVH